MKDISIFVTLWYTIEEMNNDAKFDANYDEEKNYYSIVKVHIDEEQQTGVALIKNFVDDSISRWQWDKQISLWVRNDRM